MPHLILKITHQLTRKQFQLRKFDFKTAQNPFRAAPFVLYCLSIYSWFFPWFFPSAPFEFHCCSRNICRAPATANSPHKTAVNRKEQLKVKFHGNEKLLYSLPRVQLARLARRFDFMAQRSFALRYTNISGEIRWLLQPRGHGAPSVYPSPSLVRIRVQHIFPHDLRSPAVRLILVFS